MPLSQKALKFCANHTENPYELAIVADQLTEYDKVEPRVELPRDWVSEAFTHSKAPQAAFAARTCKNADLLGQVARRDKRITVQNALATNVCLREEDFLVMLDGLLDVEHRYLRSAREKALRQAAEARRATKVAVTASPDAALARVQRVLASRGTYSTASPTATANALLEYAKDHREVVAEVLAREAEAGGAKLTLAYLKNYYCGDNSGGVEQSFFDLCSLTPHEVLTMARAKRAAFLTTLARNIGGWRSTRVPIGADVASELVAAVAHTAVERSFPDFGRPGTRQIFGPDAIDVLLEAGWDRALWGHVLSDAQFTKVAGRGPARRGRENLLANLAGDNPHHIATLLVMANTRARPGAMRNYGGNEKILWTMLRRAPVSVMHDLIERVAGLAYLLMDDPSCAAYIYARLSSAPGGVLVATEELEARSGEPLCDVVGGLGA